MTNKILKLILLSLIVILLIASFIFISTLKDKKAGKGDTTTPTTETPAAKNFFLTISSPANNATQSSKYLTVKGKTAANAEIFVNDKEGKANANGDFSINITLDEGENTIVVISNDASGNYLEKELTVTVASFQ